MRTFRWLSPAGHTREVQADWVRFEGGFAVFECDGESGMAADAVLVRAEPGTDVRMLREVIDGA